VIDVWFYFMAGVVCGIILTIVFLAVIVNALMPSDEEIKRMEEESGYY